MKFLPPEPATIGRSTLLEVPPFSPEPRSETACILILDSVLDLS